MATAKISRAAEVSARAPRAYPERPRERLARLSRRVGRSCTQRCRGAVSGRSRNPAGRSGDSARRRQHRPDRAGLASALTRMGVSRPWTWFRTATSIFPASASGRSPGLRRTQDTRKLLCLCDWEPASPPISCPLRTILGKSRCRPRTTARTAPARPLRKPWSARGWCPRSWRSSRAGVSRPTLPQLGPPAAEPAPRRLSDSA